MSRRDTSLVEAAFTGGFPKRPFRGKTSPPPPIIPVQIPEIDGLGQMPDFDVRAAVEVGDGAGHLQDAVVGAGGKAKTVHRLLQNQLSRLVNPTVFADHPAAHLRIGEQPRTTLEPLLLDFPRRHHSLADVCTSLRRFVGGQLLVADRRYLYVQVSTSQDYRYQKNCVENNT